MSTFGEVNWTDNLDFGSDKKLSGKDTFLRLTEGDNELRFVTAPHQYLSHKIKKDPNDKKDFGQKVMCSAINGSCSACTYGEAKPRWLVGVIDRKTGAAKILDVGWAVFQQIRKLAKNPKLGDPQKYDINVVVDPKAGPSGYYTVQAYSKESLSAEDQVIKENFDMEDLQRRVTPFTPEQVQKRLDKIFGDAPAAATTVTTAVVKTASVDAETKVASGARPASVDVASDDDLGEAFPAYEE